MTFEELTMAVDRMMRGPLYCYAKAEPYVVLVASDVFAEIPAKHICGMRVYESTRMPRGEVRVMRWVDVKEMLIAEDPVKIRKDAT